MLGVTELSPEESPPILTTKQERDKMRVCIDAFFDGSANSSHAFYFVLLPQSPKGGYKLFPIKANHLGLSTMDRNMKAHSVAMIPSSRTGGAGGGGGGPRPGGMLLTEWKHSSPFQNVSVIIPSPPTSLNMKDVWIEILRIGCLSCFKRLLSSSRSSRSSTAAH